MLIFYLIFISINFFAICNFDYLVNLLLIFVLAFDRIIFLVIILHLIHNYTFDFIDFKVL